jgi:cyclic-di-AMP phosphodiesterase PgpH
MMRIINILHNRFHTILTVLFFIIASLFLVLILPSEGKFMYEYQKGGFWKHEDLTAPFSFPVRKSQSEITQERDSVIKNFRPIFVYNQELSELRIREFEDDFSSKWIDYSLLTFKIPSENAYLNDGQYEVYRHLEDEYKTYMISLIREIYRKGIIDTSPIEVNGKVPFSDITLIKDNVAETRMISDLLSPKSAYEYIVERIQNSIPRKSDSPIRKYAVFFQNFEFNNYLSINVIYDEAKSKNFSRNLIDGISLTKGLIQDGQGIISKGEFIDDEKFLILESLRKEYEQNLGSIARWLVIVGKFIIVLASLLIIYLFLANYRKEVLQSNVRVSFILLVMVLFILVASITLKFNIVSIYILPFAILPVILKTFYDARLALFIHVISVLLIGFFVPNGFEFVFLNIIAGMVSVMSMSNIYRRSRVVVTAVNVIIAYSVVYLGIALIQEGNLSHIEIKYFQWFGLNGILILISYPLIYMFEKLFGFTSDATLLELSDTNQPLLRKLAELAPGTFQHSLQVANLAEDAVFSIGGNPLLVRTGALYHDIGKMDNPMYFIENQTTENNPHDTLEYEQSARIIIDHVRKGVDLARKNKLPESIVDFIRTHHGTSTVQYFYKAFLNKFPGNDLDMNVFSYPGPRPISKETAIVMMADSVEAASRSLKTISEDAIDKLVESIISNQMMEGQYNDARITFKEITAIREVFKKRLRNIYHVRISYPK